MATKRLPVSLQSVLWSRRLSSFDLTRDRDYIIHHVLRYGTLQHLQWLLQTYRPQTVRDVFLRHPMKVYSKSSLHFTKNFILDLTGRPLNQRRYLASAPR